MGILELKEYIEHLQCLKCGGSLTIEDHSCKCKDCGQSYPIENGALIFTKNSQVEPFQEQQMNNSSVTARMFNFGKRFISSQYQPQDHIAEFLVKQEPGKLGVELGSGNRRLGKNIINIDLFPFKNVDIVADIEKVPLQDSSVDYAILDTVLEHVPKPHRVVEETLRVLRPGGKVICIVPFIFPYHGYPKHYFNISRDGLEILFEEFSDLEIKVNMGPFSAWINLTAENIGVLLGGSNTFLYSLFKGLGLLPLFLFKYLDYFYSHSKRAHRTASVLTLTAQK